MSQKSILKEFVHNYVLSELRDLSLPLDVTERANRIVEKELSRFVGSVVNELLIPRTRKIGVKSEKDVYYLLIWTITGTLENPKLANLGKDADSIYYNLRDWVTDWIGDVLEKAGYKE